MKKALRIIGRIFVWLLVVLAVAMMIFTVVSVNVFDRNDRDIFGYKAFIVTSDSMSKTDFDAGDLIFVKEVNPTTIEEGDIISYLSQNSESYNEVVTHKVARKTKDSYGQDGFVTYGTNTGTEDEVIVTYPYILGKYTGHLNGVGTFFNFLKTPRGYILCIAIPFVLLIIYQGINCVHLFRKYKQEQTAKMEEERSRIEEERKKLEEERLAAAKMMEELKSLKDQLAPVAAASSSDDKPETEEAPEDNKEEAGE